MAAATPFGSAAVENPANKCADADADADAAAAAASFPDQVRLAPAFCALGSLYCVSHQDVFPPNEKQTNKQNVSTSKLAQIA